MNIQQKLDIFTERAMEHAAQQRSETAREIQESIKTAVREAEESTRRAASQLLKTETAKLERESHILTHAAQTAARQKLAELRQTLAEELLTDLESDLRSFVASPAYGDFLLEGIAAYAEHEFPTLQIMSRDIAFKEPIETETSFTIEESAEDFIGGFRLISADGRKISDQSLLARLEALRIYGMERLVG